mgnify:CR=1 FL=1
MRRLHTLTLPTLLLTMLAATTAHAAPWSESTAFSDMENAMLPSCHVDAADIIGNDGVIDLVFANSGGTTMGDQVSSPKQQQAFKGNGDGTFTEVSTEVFSATKYNGRAIKARDLDYDGDIDIVLGTTWITQSQLFINDNGTFVNDTVGGFPARPASVGDLEIGDADDDGDLDIIFSNWGEDPNSDDVVNGPGAGGVTMLWSQDGDPEYGDPGSGVFSDLTINMPTDELRMSWDLEFFDINNDYDLDIVISCKWCPEGSLFLYENDGQGNYSKLGFAAQGIDGHDIEIINLVKHADENMFSPDDTNNRNFLDIVAIHDHKNTLTRNRVLPNMAGAGFDGTDPMWDPGMGANPKNGDYTGLFYDYDSDGDPDMVLGALKTSGDMVNPFPDRLMINDPVMSAPTFKEYDSGLPEPAKRQALEETSTPSGGTCAIILADLNKDNRLDVAMSQFDNAADKYVYLATMEVAQDISAPVLNNWQQLPDPLEFPGKWTTRIRAHDNKSPLMIHDFQADGVPYIEGWTEFPDDPEANPGQKTLGQWYGEYLWRITFDIPDADHFWYRYCAIDAAGNKACTDLDDVDITGGGETTMITSNTDSDTNNSATITESDSDSVSASDSNSDSITLSGPTDSANSNTESDSMSDSAPTVDSFVSESMTDSSANSNSNTNSNSDSDSATESDTSSQLDDDGCGCTADDGPSGALASLALLGLLGFRRRRR